jgi:hypothetical protein
MSTMARQAWFGQAVSAAAGLATVDRHEMIAGDGQDVTQTKFP